MDSQTNIGELELCVPTEADSENPGVSIKEIPRVKALCVIHIGPYESMHHGYEAIEAYAKGNNFYVSYAF